MAEKYLWLVVTSDPYFLPTGDAFGVEAVVSDGDLELDEKDFTARLARPAVARMLSLHQEREARRAVRQ